MVLGPFGWFRVLVTTTHENRKYLERIEVANMNVKKIPEFIIYGDRDGSYYLSFFVR